MSLALEEAREAYKTGEVPVGCVIVKDGAVIGRGYNRCEMSSDPTAHAEMIAIKEACSKLGDWRLDGCSLYVTLEPCPMCAGAIINSRIEEVIFGAKDAQKGSVGSIIDLFCENFGRKIRVFPGVLENESKALLKSFFGELR